MFVLAHETGHIKGGHVIRGQLAYEKTQMTALISTAIGGILAIATGQPEAGIAMAMGGQSSALGAFTHYRQTEESVADRTALDKAVLTSKQKQSGAPRHSVCSGVEAGRFKQQRQCKVQFRRAGRFLILSTTKMFSSTT